MLMYITDINANDEPDLTKILLEEGWTKALEFGEEGRVSGVLFNIDENGQLFLMDELGTVALCPMGRFRVKLCFSDDIKISFNC